MGGIIKERLVLKKEHKNITRDNGGNVQKSFLFFWCMCVWGGI